MKDAIIKEDLIEAADPVRKVITEKPRTLEDEIKIAFYKLGPKRSRMDIRPVIEEEKYRINWWTKLENGDNTISFSIFITVVKTVTGYDFINETAKDFDHPSPTSPKIGEKL